MTPELPRRCWICGCTDEAACEGGCGWTTGWPDLCTACVAAVAAVPSIPVHDVDTGGRT